MQKITLGVPLEVKSLTTPVIDLCDGVGDAEHIYGVGNFNSTVNDRKNVIGTVIDGKSAVNDVNDSKNAVNDSESTVNAPGSPISAITTRHAFPGGVVAHFTDCRSEITLGQVHYYSNSDISDGCYRVFELINNAFRRCYIFVKIVNKIAYSAVDLGDFGTFLAFKSAFVKLKGILNFDMAPRRVSCDFHVKCKFPFVFVFFDGKTA